MTDKPNAIVIGTGIDGISTAAYLAKYGYNVTVFEKSATPGVRCNQIAKGGQRFDTEPAQGDWYPMSGMCANIQALVNMAEKLGVAFHYNAPVKRIETNSNEVVGVLLEDGRMFSADLFIVNAELPSIYKGLLPDPGVAKTLEEKLYPCSPIMFYWEIDKKYPQIDHHNVILAGNDIVSFDQILQDHSLPEVPRFYVHAPARTDPQAVPQGQDTLYVLVPVGHLDSSRDPDWEAMVDRAREMVFTRFEKEMGIGDLREHIKFEIINTPTTWQEQYNLVKGAAFGLNHNFWQVGCLRRQYRHRKYPNLFFAGTSTHPVAGFPIVLRPVKLTTQRVLTEKGTISLQNMVNAAAAATK